MNYTPSLNIHCDNFFVTSKFLFIFQAEMSSFQEEGNECSYQMHIFITYSSTQTSPNHCCKNRFYNVSLHLRCCNFFQNDKFYHNILQNNAFSKYDHNFFSKHFRNVTEFRRITNNETFLLSLAQEMNIILKCGNWSKWDKLGILDKSPNLLLN